MKRFIQEFMIALMVCWLAFAALSGCAVDQHVVYQMITATKAKVFQPKILRLPASNVSFKGSV